MKSSNHFYSFYKDRSAIIDALRTLLLNEAVSGDTVAKLISIVQTEATVLKRHDVLEDLHFAGLIYG